MTKPRAHPTVFCAWPQGRPGIFSEIYSSRSLALTLFFESVTLHPSLPPASFVFCSPRKCKVWANRTKWSKSFSAHPSHALKKATCFIFQSLFTLLPTALTVKPEDSSQRPLARDREDLGKQDTNKRVPKSWNPHCLHYLGIPHCGILQFFHFKVENMLLSSKINPWKLHVWGKYLPGIFWSLEVDMHFGSQRGGSGSGSCSALVQCSYLLVLCYCFCKSATGSHLHLKFILMISK